MSLTQNEGVGFLCAALVPSGRLYDQNLDSTPSISDCFSALNDYRETQSIAASILLHALVFVGCDQKHVTELQQLIHGAQETVVDARSTPNNEIHALIPDKASQKVYFRELLHDVHGDLPKTDKKALMHLSVCHLNPTRNVNYTSSLFVHFAHLIEQEVITPSNVQCLCHWLNIMGKQKTLKKIDNYCRTASIPIPKRTSMLHNDIVYANICVILLSSTGIERYSVYSTNTSALASMSASPSAPLSESVTMGSPTIQGNKYFVHVGNAEPATVGSMDSDHFPQPVEGTSHAHEIVHAHSCKIHFVIFRNKLVTPCFNGRISECWKFKHYPYGSIKEG